MWNLESYLTRDIRESLRQFKVIIFRGTDKNFILLFEYNELVVKATN